MTRAIRWPELSTGARQGMYLRQLGSAFVIILMILAAVLAGQSGAMNPGHFVGKGSVVPKELIMQSQAGAKNTQDRKSVV